MLDKLKSDDFVPSTGQACTLIAADGTALPVTLTSVREVPSARGATVVERRTPFTLVFRGAPDTPLKDGIYTVQWNGRELPGVFLSRIVNSWAEPASCFQAVFN